VTSRERVLCSIQHREPDRIPLDLGSTPSSGISAIAYSRLVAYMGKGGPGAQSTTRIYDVVQELAQPEEWILDSFRVDVLDIGRTFNTEESDWRPTILSDGSPAMYPKWFSPKKEGDSLVVYDAEGDCIAAKPSGATFYDQRFFPYIDGYPDDFSGLDRAMGKVLWSALVHSPWDHASDPDFWTTLRNRARRLREQSDRALVIVVGCNLFEWGTFLRRMDNFLMDLYTDQKNVERLLDALMERHLATLEKVCEAVGDIADILRFGDDLGLDSGPFMSRDVYRRLFKPRHKRLCEYVKSHSAMHTFLHSCGSLYELMPDLIDAGYEIINPVQTNARNMEPELLKREFGRDITFWGGGVDTRTVLNCGTPGEVADQVKRRLDVFSKDGGFVFNTVHNILPDVPPQNILAMYDAVSEYNGV